jgi:hypothetical protein
MQPHSLQNISVVENSAAIESMSLSNPKNRTGTAKSALDAAIAVWLQVGNNEIPARSIIRSTGKRLHEALVAAHEVEDSDPTLGVAPTT